jgi:hypothetical protein
LERAFVEQRREALARRHLSAFVLLVDALLATPENCPLAHLAQGLQVLLRLSVRRHHNSLRHPGQLCVDTPAARQVLEKNQSEIFDPSASKVKAKIRRKCSQRASMMPAKTGHREPFDAFPQLVPGFATSRSRRREKSRRSAHFFDRAEVEWLAMDLE